MFGLGRLRTSIARLSTSMDAITELADETREILARDLAALKSHATLQPLGGDGRGNASEDDADATPESSTNGHARDESSTRRTNTRRTTASK